MGDFVETAKAIERGAHVTPKRYDVRPRDGNLYRGVGMLSRPVFGKLETLRHTPSVTEMAGRRQSMKRDEALALLEGYRAELKKYGVKSIAVFGSVARNEATEGSDIDILVEFGQSVGLFEFVRIKTRLEKILNRPVDLVTPEALKKQLKEKILKEAVYAA